MKNTEISELKKNILLKLGEINKEELEKTQITQNNQIPEINIEKKVEETEIIQSNEKENELFDEEKIKFIQETLLYDGDDPYSEKLVQRPDKGVSWGLGGELLRLKKGINKYYSHITKVYFFFREANFIY